MKRFTVSCDLLVPVLLEIDANNEDEAIDKLYEIQHSELLKLANTEDSAMCILNGSETIEEAP